MSFFISKNETIVDKLMDSDTLMKIAPDYYGPRFDAIKELRDMDEGMMQKGAGFKRVASLVNVPLQQTANLFDPTWMKSKQKFYAWLDRGENRRYCTYDRRGRADRQAQFERDFGHIIKKEVAMDRFTENTTPDPIGSGVVLKGEALGAKMPTTFDHAGLNHAADPGAAAPGINADSNDGTFKGSKSNPGLG